MPRRYAETTDVSIDKSQAEIKALLRQWGATAIAIGEDSEANVALLMFRKDTRHIRLHIPLPPPGPIRQEQSNQYRQAGQVVPGKREQIERQRWRAALIYIKGLKEAIDLGFISFEQAFLAHTLLPDGQTVGQWAEPQVAATYRTGQMPPLLPGLSPRQLGPGRED